MPYLTSHDIACHFCVSHIAGASTPGSRLNNMLDNLYHDRPLTRMARGQLLEWGLPALYQLACGELSYEAYIASLAPELVAREQESRTQAAEDLARRAAAFAASKLRRERERHRRREGDLQARAERRERERPAEESQREQTWKADESRRKQARDAEQARLVAIFEEQSRLNRTAAEATCVARCCELGAMPGTEEIARYFYMHNEPAALQRPLANILEVLYCGQVVAIAYLNYLEIKGWQELYGLALGRSSYQGYLLALQAELERKAHEQAEIEAAHVAAENARAAMREAERRRREQAEAERIARESDPAWILRKKYAVGKLAADLLQPVMDILQRFDAGQRLTEVDFGCLLADKVKGAVRELLRQAHLREAESLAAEYRRTHTPWNAVNASGHYRKADAAQKALELLDAIPASQLGQLKLKSALLTTRGGTLRDLGRHSEALQMGEQAHALQPRNFRPCTLLGALHIELGHYVEGQEWFLKAEQRGATRDGTDAELRGIILRVKDEEREALCNFLQQQDRLRYAWVRKLQKATKGAR